MGMANVSENIVIFYLLWLISDAINLSRGEQCNDSELLKRQPLTVHTRVTIKELTKMQVT